MVSFLFILAQICFVQYLRLYKTDNDRIQFSIKNKHNFLSSVNIMNYSSIQSKCFLGIKIRPLKTAYSRRLIIKPILTHKNTAHIASAVLLACAYYGGPRMTMAIASVPPSVRPVCWWDPAAVQSQNRSSRNLEVARPSF